MAAELTPMMEQYMRFKQTHSDAILLFRMGDFYETFFEDAKEVSRILGLTLTSRNHSNAEDIPLAGLPYHALDTYLFRLIKAGKKVAICEQMEAPQKGKKIVRREVVQIVSPGTVLSDNLLDQKRNNYLVTLFVEGDSAGVALCDLSTGGFRVLERNASLLWETIEQFSPSEVVVPETWAAAHEAEFAERLPLTLLSRMEDWYFGFTYAHDALLAHFKVSSLKGFGCEDLKVGICAAGGALCYLKENQKGAISHITRLSREKQDAFMGLDLVTQRNLELVASLQDGRKEGTLFSVMDATCTAPGARSLRVWLSEPLLGMDRIQGRLDTVEELVGGPGMRDGVRKVLRQVGDLERLMSKICCGRANPRDLVGVKISLQAIPPLRVALDGAVCELLTLARDQGLPDLGELADQIENTIADDPPLQLSDGGILRSGFNAELDELRQIASGGRDWVAQLQAKAREETGISSLKVGYNRAFGYYIEVTKTNLDRVPEEFIRKQTLVNAERFITPELKEWEAKILGADERAKDLEKQLFLDLREQVAGWVEPVQKTAQTVAAVDVLASMAEIAVRNDFVRPEVDSSTSIEIRNGRHPVIEQLLPSGQFVPNDLNMSGEKDQILLITGPNMAGKSTILRQVGLIVLMAQVGSFVPAETAQIGIVDRIFTRVGASDNLAKGESTFLVEMNEAANILNNASPKSLVLLDEIGRGTSTFDGLSIAWAMTEYLHSSAGIRPRTLFATHYHELTELEELLPRVRNFSVAVRESGDEIVFLHQLVAGGCDHSYGIEVARLAGMPPELIRRAKEVLARLERNDLSFVRSATRKRNGGIENQIPLFGQSTSDITTVQESPIVQDLRDLDLTRMTPLEALMKLDEWKRKDGEATKKEG